MDAETRLMHAGRPADAAVHSPGLGRRLARRRTRLGLGVAQAAAIAGISPDDAGSIERGRPTRLALVDAYREGLSRVRLARLHRCRRLRLIRQAKRAEGRAA